MRAILLLPPAKTSNEVDTFRAMPRWDLVVVAGEGVPDRAADVVLPATRLPVIGSARRWTVPVAWIRGLDELDVGPIDLVVSLELCGVTSLQANRLARRLGVPHAVWIFQTLPRFVLYRVPPWRSVTRRVASAAAGFICVNDLARQAAVANGCPPERCVALSPGIDLSFWAPAPGGRATDPIVAFVGALRAGRHGGEKGVREVIEACRRARAAGNQTRLVIVGDGPLRRNVERACAQHDFVEYRGRMPRSGVVELLRSSRVFCIAPRANWRSAEQFGFAAVEAMASGLPVVITRSGAIPDVVPPWNPIVPEGDVDGLARGITAALGQDGDVWGQRNRAHALEHFEVNTQGAKFADALEQIALGSQLKG